MFLGDAFDVTGDRTRMDFKTKQNGDQRTDDYVKRDSQTMEFEVPVPAGGEKEVTYTVVYTW